MKCPDCKCTMDEVLTEDLRSYNPPVYKCPKCRIEIENDDERDAF